jgi:hypothetical protein
LLVANLFGDVIGTRTCAGTGLAMCSHWSSRDLSLARALRRTVTFTLVAVPCGLSPWSGESKTTDVGSKVASKGDSLPASLRIPLRRLKLEHLKDPWHQDPFIDGAPRRTEVLLPQRRRAPSERHHVGSPIWCLRELQWRAEDSVSQRLGSGNRGCE